MVRSWDVAGDLPALDLRSVIRRERREVLRVLRSLAADQWAAQTACAGWTVHDVALHLLGNDFGRLGPPSSASLAGAEAFDGLATAIEHGNDAWVEAARRIPPQILPDLLALTGRCVDTALAAVDLDAPGVAVLWTGTGPTPYWLDIAREYTERWTHHAQIREAVGRRPLLGRRWLHPVLDAFMRSLSRAYEGVAAPTGASVEVVVTGAAGGTWRIERARERWRMVAPRGEAPDVVVAIPSGAAWRLLARVGDVEAARHRARLSGDVELGQAALQAVAIMTTRL